MGIGDGVGVGLSHARAAYAVHSNASQNVVLRRTFSILTHLPVNGLIQRL